MRVVVLAVEETQSLDVTGPVEVFDAAGRVAVARGLRSAPPYEIALVTPGGGSVACSSGLRLHADPLPPADEPVDTILAAGGTGMRELRPDDAAVAWLRAAAPRARRVTSVCTGAFALASAGLLSGRRATTHWAHCRALAEAHPDVVVDPEPIYVRDGDVWTSAGVTAGMDLALALVEEDLGRAVPAVYVEALRVERARALLEDDHGVEAAARTAGFASAEVLRRTFHRRLGVSPAAYRERFRSAA